jgi:hypothetical protein
VYSIAIDGSGKKWMGTYDHGLVKFDGTDWTVYKTDNSGMPNNCVNTVAIDAKDNKWIVTLGGGMAKFDDTKWTVYNSTNSGLQDNWLNTLVIDGNENKWIGTNNGLAVFKEGGVILSAEESQKAENPETIGLFQNYPNPFNSNTTISYKITEPCFVSLKVFNAMGIEVATLVNERKSVGEYTIDWNTAELTGGIYFCKLQNGDNSEVRKMLLMK